MGSLASRFDGTDPVFQNPLENLVFWGMCKREARTLSRGCSIPADRSVFCRLSAGATGLFMVVFLTMKCAGVNMKDRDGDGIPDMA